MKRDAPRPLVADEPKAGTVHAMPTPSPRRISSAALLGMAHEIEIEHEQQIYRLRRTSLGKLILTK